MDNQEEILKTLKSIENLLREQLAFWKQITSEEYIEERLKEEAKKQGFKIE